MPVDINIIKSLNFFKDFSHADLEEIAPLIDQIRTTEGERITCRGCHADTFFIIFSGNFMISFKHDRSYTLHDRGDIMGLSTLIMPFAYTGTAVALTEGAVLSMPGEKLLRIIQSNSELGEKIMKKINEIVEKRMPFVTGRC